MNGPAIVLPVLILLALSSNLTHRAHAAEAASAPAAGSALYVSPSGNDAWSGRLPEPAPDRTDGPLATVQKARDLLRQTKSARREPAAVILRAGTYRQDKPIEFTAADSGTAECPVTYKAYPGERPVISGGRVIRGWRRHEGEGKAPRVRGLWCAALPSTGADTPWHFNQLFVNGERRTRARFPNKGSFLRADGPVSKDNPRAFYYKDGDVRQWEDIGGAIFVVYHSWETSLHHVRAVDPNALQVTFVEPAPWPMGQWEKQQRYYIENIFEALDAPGEWYLNEATATVYYYPLPGEDPEKAEVVAPALTSTLFAVSGQPSKNEYVEHLRFAGITFAHSNANLRRIRNPGQGEIFQPALIHATGLRHSSFEDCEVAHTGAHGIWFAAGCEDNAVRRCHMHDLGGGGVYIGGGWGVHDTTPTRRIVVDNNFIHDGSYLFHGAHGVWIGTSSSNSVTHNEISNFDYSGISCGWSWGFQPSSANNNAIDYNHIHHLGNGDGLSDMGGIYTLGISPGTTERGNHIHHVYNYAPVSHGSGIYPDEGSSEILIEDNVVYRVRTSPLFQHYGTNNIVRNNILAFGGEAQLRRCREDKPCHYVATGNIVYSDIDQMLGGVWKNGDWRLGSNVYWCTAGQPKFKDMDFATWQSKGKDAGSMVADPLFMDAGRGDFRLKQDSPAARTGFRQIDVGKAGLYGDQRWTELPRRYPDRPLNDFPAPVEPPFVINSDFETDEAGKAPFDGQILQGPDQAVTVSSEMAAGGRQSLKFVDAPAQTHAWTPHLYYRTSCESSEFELSWDMWNAPDAPSQFYLEARQWDTDPYLVGPSLSVDANGKVQSGKHAIGTIPLGQWVHVDIRFRLGQGTDGRWRATLSGAGRPPITAEIPFANGQFKKVTWFGVSSTSNSRGVFYIDNLKLGTPAQLAATPKRRPPARPQSEPRLPNAPDMLAGSWDFEDTRGYTATDASGCGNDGELWASWAKGKFGSAIYCDSAAPHVNVPDSPSLHLGTSDFSIALWICPTELNIASRDARRRFISKTARDTWWNVNITSDGKPFIELRDSNKAMCASRPAGSIPQNAWSHLAIVVDRAHRKIRYYLNGAPDSALDIPASFSGHLDVPNGDLTIGSQWQPFIGLLDDVKLYRRALTEDDVRTAFIAGQMRHNSVAYQVIE